MVTEEALTQPVIDTSKKVGVAVALAGGLATATAYQASRIANHATKNVDRIFVKKKCCSYVSMKDVRFELAEDRTQSLLANSSGRNDSVLPVRRAQVAAMASTVSQVIFVPIQRKKMDLQHVFQDDNRRHIVAGTLARTIAQCFIHPLDTMKTRMQVNKPSPKLQMWKDTVQSHPLDLVKNPSDMMRGFSGSLFGTIPVAFLYFAAYEWTQEKLANVWTQGQSSATHVVAASTGALASSIVRVPTDTARHQVQAYMQGNFFQALGNIIKERGVLGLYRGFIPTLLRDVPEIAIQFSTYEFLRHARQQHGGHEKLRTYEHLLLGGMAGAIAACCTMPMDYMKTRQQTGQVQLSLVATFRSVLTEEGALGFFKGLTPRLIQTTVMSALFFGLFEYSKLLLKPDRVAGDKLVLPKLVRKRRNHVWKRQFVYRN